MGHKRLFVYPPGPTNVTRTLGLVRAAILINNKKAKLGLDPFLSGWTKHSGEGGKVYFNSLAWILLCIWALNLFSNIFLGPSAAVGQTNLTGSQKIPSATEGWSCEQWIKFERLQPEKFETSNFWRKFSQKTSQHQHRHQRRSNAFGQKCFGQK